MVHKRFLVGLAAAALAFFATASPSVALPSHDLHLAAAAVACSVVKTDMNLITDIDLTNDSAGAGPIIAHGFTMGVNDLLLADADTPQGFDQRRSAVTAAVRTNGLLIDNTATFDTEGLAAEATGTIAVA